jgi:hypothetical protein
MQLTPTSSAGRDAHAFDFDARATRFHLIEYVTGADESSPPRWRMAAPFRKRR